MRTVKWDDVEFRSLPGTDFLDQLVRRLRMTRLAVGENFKCGRDLELDAQAIFGILGRKAVRVDIAPPLIDNGTLISSTRIRNTVRSGALATAERLLGRRFVLDTRDAVVENHGDCWRLGGFSQVLPPAGSYRVLIEGESTVRTAHINHNYVGIPSRETRCPAQIEFLPTGG